MLTWSASSTASGIQGQALDLIYLRAWAERLDLIGLLARALEEAGL